MRIAGHEERIYGAVAAMAADPDVSDIEYVETIRALRHHCTSSARTLLANRPAITAGGDATPDPHDLCVCGHERYEHGDAAGPGCTVIEDARRIDDEFCRCEQFAHRAEVWPSGDGDRVEIREESD